MLQDNPAVKMKQRIINFTYPGSCQCLSLTKISDTGKINPNKTINQHDFKMSSHLVQKVHADNHMYARDICVCTFKPYHVQSVLDAGGWGNSHIKPWIWNRGISVSCSEWNMRNFSTINHLSYFHSLLENLRLIENAILYSNDLFWLECCFEENLTMITLRCSILGFFLANACAYKHPLAHTVLTKINLLLCLI